MTIDADDHRVWQHKNQQDTEAMLQRVRHRLRRFCTTYAPYLPATEARPEHETRTSLPPDEMLIDLCTGKDD